MAQQQNNIFNTFWMAGFECTDKLNAFGNRVDFLQTTGHLDLIDEDYKRLYNFSMATVREGIRWSQVETAPYVYDWSTVGSMIEAAKRNNIQQVWDLCHFGFPDDLTLLVNQSLLANEYQFQATNMAFKDNCINLSQTL